MYVQTISSLIYFQGIKSFKPNLKNRECLSLAEHSDFNEHIKKYSGLLSLICAISLKFKTSCLMVILQKVVHAVIASRLDYEHYYQVVLKNYLKSLQFIQSDATRVLKGARK